MPHPCNLDAVDNSLHRHRCYVKNIQTLQTEKNNFLFWPGRTIALKASKPPTPNACIKKQKQNTSETVSGHTLEDALAQKPLRQSSLLKPSSLPPGTRLLPFWFQLEITSV